MPAYRDGVDDGTGPEGEDRDLEHLDDTADREELRQRYYGLLQELRVLLPGVEVLVAFLLGVPFAQGFSRLDQFGRALYGIALAASIASTICLVTPTALHRVAERTARRARLRWAIRLSRVGLVLMAVAWTAGMWCVARFIFSSTTTVVLVLGAVSLIVGLWLVLPLVINRSEGQRPAP
jgi:Family of unknown function (DUF6328)